jgi:hypothetical protein
MAFNFPSSPSDGDIYEDYVYNAAKNAWLAIADNTAMVIPSPTPPANPADNLLWLNTEDGVLFFRYNDGDSTQWVEMQNPANYVSSFTVASLESRLATLEEIETKKSYAQINKITLQNFGTGFNTIALDEILFERNISLVGNLVRFVHPGVYKISVGMRFANNAGDSWTGASLWNATAGRVGISYGTGNVSGDPGPVEFTFMANVTNVNVDYALQLYRASSIMSQLTPDSNAGKAVAATFERLN